MDIITAWTPILNNLSGDQRDRARQLIEKYGETCPTCFITELLELFGIHTAYLQTLPAQLTMAGEQAKRQVQAISTTATDLQERTRLQLEELVSKVARSGAGLTNAIQQATEKQSQSVNELGAGLGAKIQQEFEKQNLPALTNSLQAMQTASAKAIAQAEQTGHEQERLKNLTQERFNALKLQYEESLASLEVFNWRRAWAVCGAIWFAFFAIVAVVMYYRFQTDEEVGLAGEIASASATIEQNRQAFAQLNAAGIALHINRSADTRTGQAIPGGFAIIVENAQGAELRDYNDGKAGFVFVISPHPEDRLRVLQFRVREMSKGFEADKK
jgi:hypothetical protein